MKLWLAAAVFLTSSAMAQLPSFSFPAPKIELPAIPLIDRAKEKVPNAQPMDDAAKWFRGVTPKQAPKTERYSSGMPIVRPSDKIDPKMVHAPRTDIDFKMIVKKPEVAARGAGDAPKQLGDAKRGAEAPERNEAP